MNRVVWKLAMRDLQKSFLLVLFINVALITISVYAYASIHQIGKVFQYQEEVVQKSKWDITYFRIGYDDTRIMEMPLPLSQHYQRILEEKKAYATLQSSCMVDGVEVPAILVLGNKEVALSKTLAMGKEGSAYVGKDIRKGAADTVDWQRQEFRIDSIMPSGSFMLLRDQPVSLDGTVLFFVSWEDCVKKFTMVDYEGIVFSTALVDASVNEIVEHVNIVEKYCYSLLSPYSLNTVLRQQAASLGEGTAFLVIFYVAAMIFILAALVISLLMQIQTNTKEYVIHVAYGASIGTVLLRVFLYLLCMLLLPCIFLSIVVTTFRFGGNSVAVVPLVTIAIAITVMILPFMRIRRMDLTNMIRGD